jgi:ribosomal-protein-alanine N-acetyltransferase
MTIIKTQRLAFRTWKKEDADLAVKLWGDPEVMKFLDVRGELSKQQVIEKLEREIGFQEKFGIQYWVLCETETGDFVGCCGLKPWIYTEDNCPELGFHLVKEKWGQGYAKEASMGVINYAKQKLKATKLMAGHHPKNEGSRKVLLNLGFSFVKDVFFEPTGLHHPTYQLILE